MVFQIIVIALALSLDSFTEGIAYGLAGMNISQTGRISIALAASGAFALSIAGGDLLQALLPNWGATFVSVILLLLLGFYFLYRNLQSKSETKLNQDNMLWQLNLPNLGVIIQVLRDPHALDHNQDKTIGLGEATLLGIALSVDSLGAGLAIGVMGFPIGTTVAIVFLTTFLMLTLALRLGKYLGHKAPIVSKFAERYASYIPALVLITLGLVKLQSLITGS